MKLVSYIKEEREQLGVLVNDIIYDMEVLHPDLPNSMSMFLNYWEDHFPVAQAGELMLKEGTRTSNKGVPLKDVQLLAPVPFHRVAGMVMLFASMWQQQEETVKWI